MADLRCPNCGRDNPDFLDTCQFCQSPLMAESTLQTGDSPVKRDTGELEPILPQWLRDVRQQARESAEEDAAARAAQAKRRNEPPDLLAGLASQARDEDEDVPDWLASINPAVKPKTSESTPAETSTDFFSQFTRSSPEPATPRPEETAPAQEEMPSWMDESPEVPQAGGEKDELSEWFAKTAAEPEEVVEVERDPSAGGMDMPSFRIKEPEPPKEEEDLSWLHSLEAAAFQPEKQDSPQQDSSSSEAQPVQPAGEGEDLSWLNELGGMSANIPAEAAPSTTAPALEPEEPEQVPTSAEQNDLSWLDQLGSFNETEIRESQSAPPASQESLDQLNAEDSQERQLEEKPAGDPGWLQSTDQNDSATPGERAGPFEARKTGPLDEGKVEDSMPDWLKSATEEPSMPPPGALSEWFRESESAKADKPPISQPQTDSAQNVDSILSGGLPDWFSGSEQVEDEPSAPAAQGGNELAPVDLPAWVQAMRPVESIVEETPSLEAQPTERDGPLAGLRGVIPVAPIGSSLRPRPISLKLQVSEEQQAGAVILEQILSGETNPKPLATTPFVATQRALRWVLSGIFIIVLGGIIYLGTQSMLISAALPAHVSSASNAVVSLPQGSSVLVVIDYEPALAGELEVVSGPMLDQLALPGRSRLSFVATSPNSSALVERLLVNTGLRLPQPNGPDYKPGVDYFNLGYLPGGAAGVVEFVESPVSALPSAGVASFSEYAAVIVLTDHSDSARVWVEQLDARKRIDPALSNQPLLAAASAQAGPLLLPYVSSGQITGMVNGIPEAARYEFVNNSRPGPARRYWDAFGVGLLMAIIIITTGSAWNVLTGIRERRAEAELG